MEKKAKMVYISGALTDMSEEDRAKLRQFYTELGEICTQFGFEPYLPHVYGDPKLVALHPDVFASARRGWGFLIFPKISSCRRRNFKGKINPPRLPVPQSRSSPKANGGMLGGPRGGYCRNPSQPPLQKGRKVNCDGVYSLWSDGS